MATKTTESNGVEEKKPGIVRKVTKITFTIGPIRQEDLSTPEINRVMAMAQRFDIKFDTIPILDSNQTDKLGYLTLPYEIRTQDYLLVLYDRLTNLKLRNREVNVKFPEELKRHVDECRQKNHEAKKKAIEEEKEKMELMKRSLYATYVDKDTGRDSLLEKFPEAKEIVLRQHNFQWFGCMEFENADEALKVLKQANQIEIEGQKVKIVRQPPDFEEKKPSAPRSAPQQHQQQRNRGGGGGGHKGPRPLLSMGPNRGGGMGGGYGRGGMMGNMGGGGDMYGRYGGSYGGGYGGGGNFRQQGNYQAGAKRKSDLGDFGGSAKKPFGGSSRGGYGGQGGGWNRF